MNLLETVVETPLAGAVGWTLLHSLWQGAIIALALAAALLIFRSPRLRYAAACTAMLLLLGGFCITLAHLMPENQHAARTLAARGIPAWKVRALITSPSRWEPSLGAIAPWLAPFWLAGVFVSYLLYSTGFLSVRRFRRRGVCSAPQLWQDQLVRLSARIRLTRPILLLESSLADTPMVIGHLRPLILMPVGVLTGLPAAQIEAILLHELAHIRRHDYLVNALQRALEGLLFYHPAVWWISRVIRTERENCCDDVVVSISGNVHEYAFALAALEQNRWSGRVPAVAATGGSLVKRIRRLLYPKRPHAVWTPFLAALILIATTAITLGAWQSEPRNSPAAQSQTAGANKYSKWLNWDVAYIIADAERSSFEKLTTDEERDKFIIEFWLRRDPTPDTSENEFKEEHYRRLAYSNEHFRTASGRPGWQTDRGRMYIVFGPPDEIDSHPGPKDRQPYEIWGYRHVEGIGDNLYLTFVDPTGEQDFHLAPGNPPDAATNASPAPRQH
jgi:GWxTD domain-containing protein